MSGGLNKNNEQQLGHDMALKGKAYLDLPSCPDPPSFHFLFHYPYITYMSE